MANLYNKKTSVMRRMSQFELGFVAGILEGEGCFTIKRQKGRYLYAHIDVQSADLDVLEKLLRFTGLGTIAGPFKTRAAHHSPMYGWRLCSDDAKTLMGAVFQYMSERRQERIIEVLESAR